MSAIATCHCEAQRAEAIPRGSAHVGTATLWRIGSGKQVPVMAGLVSAIYALAIESTSCGPQGTGEDRRDKPGHDGLGSTTVRFIQPRAVRGPVQTGNDLAGRLAAYTSSQRWPA